MIAQDAAALPWPVLFLQPDGQITASPGAERLLGFAPGDAQALERRVEITLPAGVADQAAQFPWQHGDPPFDQQQLWRDRAAGTQQRLRVRGGPVPGGFLIILEADGRPAAPAERADAAVQAIHQSLLSRKSELPLRELLRMLVQLACDLTGARYGALGVLARDGSRLRDFIHVGMDDEVAHRIGHLPMGRGLLGAVIHEARTLRIADITADRRSAGFPAHHPPMTSFLGVPLRIGERIFGNFYVTNKQGAPAFTDEDARHLERFSAQAALAVAFLERAEEENRHVFRALVEHAPYGIAFFPSGSGEAFGNAAAERMLGRVAPEDDPDRTYELRRPDGAPLPPDEAPGLRALRGEASLNVEVQIAREGREPMPALLSAAPVRSDEALPLGAVIVYQDISTLKELERLRAQFAAVVAHDMRTPVQSVMLQVESLLRRAGGEAAWVPVATLQTMKRSGQHLSRLIGDLLDASQLEANQLPINREVLDVKESVGFLLQRLHATLGERQVIVDAQDAPTVYADPVRFDQILTNLIENAAKYSPDEAPVHVGIASARGGALITVRDEGPGIAADELPHLFERHFRGRAARGRKRGLGLGLYITHGLVAEHGGTLAAKSTAGAGATFELWLPGPPRPAGVERDSPTP